jgi:uncharacterized repeat protein (TIGR01451 family)
MMVRGRLSLVLLSLVIAALWPGQALYASHLASPQVAQEGGLVGQEGGESYSVALQGAYAYLGIGPSVAVLDVSVPTAPVRVGRSAPLPDIVQGLAVSGDTVYVANGESGLLIVDVGHPASPAWEGWLDTPGSAQNVAVAEDHAYVADGDGGLRIVDVSNPLAPAEVAALTASTLGGEATGVAAVEDTAYVGAGAGGLVIVDVTVPANPQIIGRYQVPGVFAEDVAILGATVYAVDGGNLRVLALNASSPSSPLLINSSALSVGLPHDLTAAESHVYVATDENGVAAFEIDPTGGLISLYRHDTPGVAHDVVASGNYVYVADGRAGLRIVDVLTVKVSPVEVGAYRTLGDALGLAASGSHAYVAAGEHGLSVMDLADPANPAQVGSVDTSGYAQAVAVGGTRAYIADGNGGLAVADVANPTNPVLLKQLPLPGSGYAWAVALQGNSAYLAAESEGLQVVNVSDPAAPSLVGGGFKPAGGDAVWDVAVAGNYAYLAAGLSGVHVVDISIPAAPHEVAVVPSGDWAQAVALAGGYAYIADIDGGLRIADVSDPASPVLVTSYTGLPGAVLNVTINGRHALVTTEDSVHVLYISVPANPLLRASYKTPGSPHDVAVGDAVLVADFDGGLRVLNPADVAVSATTAPAWPLPGAPLTLAITVVNYGPLLAGGIQLTDTLPAGLAFVSASSGCAEASGVVTCAIGSLTSGATAEVSITVTPSGSGAFKNMIVVSSSATEINEPNNTVVQAIVVGGHATFLPLIVR